MKNSNLSPALDPSFGDIDISTVQVKPCSYTCDISYILFFIHGTCFDIFGQTGGSVAFPISLSPVAKSYWSSHLCKWVICVCQHAGITITIRVYLSKSTLLDMVMSTAYDTNLKYDNFLCMVTTI